MIFENPENPGEKITFYPYDPYDFEIFEFSRQNLVKCFSLTRKLKLEFKCKRSSLRSQTLKNETFCGEILEFSRQKYVTSFSVGAKIQIAF